MTTTGSGSESQIRRMKLRGAVRRLVVIFGDQLDAEAAWRDDFDRERDAVLMMEVEAESRHVPSHKQRTVLFLSAMRHFAVALRDSGVRVHYVALEDDDNTQDFQSEINRAIESLQPACVACVLPGEWRVRRIIKSVCQAKSIVLELLDDRHFFTTPDEFSNWARGRKSIVLEHFYRRERKRLNVLMDEGNPVGGAWNFDKENRQTFKGAPRPPSPPSFKPDSITSEVIDLVERRLSNLPGSLDSFDWPVTREQATQCLSDFVENRLAKFGPYQDAMWSDQRTLYHSRLSSALNLKLLSPRECVDSVVRAFYAGHAPLNSVEGFVRQLIGWREFIRGIYWREGDDYADRNGLLARGSLPEFYWDGDTDMACMRDSLQQVIDDGHGHHIQRLMVTGNFALIAGVHPRAISGWYLGMYVDGIDWVTLPNTLGMSQHADGGVVGTKPYAASGAYINRMSNYCKDCQYDVKSRTGQDACPFNTLYWHFLIRNRDRLGSNQRMALVMKNLESMDEHEQVTITREGDALRRRFGVTSS